jgi:hypothetical protein
MNDWGEAVLLPLWAGGRGILLQEGGWDVVLEEGGWATLTLVCKVPKERNASFFIAAEYMRLQSTPEKRYMFCFSSVAIPVA